MEGDGCHISRASWAGEIRMWGNFWSGYVSNTISKGML